MIKQVKPTINLLFRSANFWFTVSYFLTNIELFNSHIVEYHSMTSIVPYFGRFDYVSIEHLTHTYTPIISPSSVSYTDKQHIYVIQSQLKQYYHNQHFMWKITNLLTHIQIWISIQLKFLFLLHSLNEPKFFFLFFLMHMD